MAIEIWWLGFKISRLEFGFKNFGVWDIVLGVWGLRFGVWSFGHNVLELRTSKSQLRAWVLEFCSMGFLVWGFLYVIWSSKFGVWNFGVWEFGFVILVVDLEFGF